LYPFPRSSAREVEIGATVIMPPESISRSDGDEQEVALVLIDPTRHAWSMTATAVLNTLARRGRSSTARAPHVARGAVISIRIAGQEEAGATARLAALAERPVPSGRALIAEVDGEVWAALPLASGKAIVDPFRPSSEIQQLLMLRAAQLELDAA
jgi:hypothetical protein